MSSFLCSLVCSKHAFQLHVNNVEMRVLSINSLTKNRTNVHLLYLLHDRNDVDEELFSEFRFAVDHETFEQATSTSDELIE